jgi:ribosomal-protein-alanine N-acetyltransferase
MGTPPVSASEQPPEPLRLPTSRLLLREFTLDDAPAVLSSHQDPRYLRFSPWEHRTEAGAREFVQRFVDWQRETPRTGYQLAIALADTGELIGNVGLRLPARYALVAEAGFELDPRHWGNGYATEAARGLVQYGFRELGLQRVHSHCVIENTASARVLERLGMKLEGKLRQHEFFKGRWWDVLLYGILASEWNPL